ncbi:MAG: helix-turn-helix domain-containing protein [Elusimicrobia bacterium]|nr:helix-turn-helix domain-containing protein [Elusimicrobiota bacterium]
MKRDVAALKRALAKQKRLVTQLQHDNARLLADLNSRLAAPPAASEDEVKGARLGPASIHGQRKRLGLSREAFAKLVGVSGGSIGAWEGGKSKPRAAAKAALVAIRKLGRREARQRLEAVKGANGGDRKVAASGHRNGKKAPARASAKS